MVTETVTHSRKENGKYSGLGDWRETSAMHGNLTPSECDLC